ncbi:MAG: hypothetical protein GYA23_06795 [Methanomicrobiales archaeon]|nr:hypothetical protein [Methanomicrobiales archaeon]
MADENQQTSGTGSQQAQPREAARPAPAEGQAEPQERQNQGQRRNDRRDRNRPRHHSGRRDHQRRDGGAQQPRPAHQPKPADTRSAGADTEDEGEENGHDRSPSQGRHHHRSGKPPKRVIEEWENDPYCE